MIKVKKASYVSEYRIKIQFNNGETKVVDFEKWIFGQRPHVYLDPLKDLQFFKQFDLDESNYSICWPNGADFSPDVLYEAGEKLNKRKGSKTGKKSIKKRKSKFSKI